MMLKNKGSKLIQLVTCGFSFLICTTACAQLTEKDFKLLLDGKDYSQDTTIALETILNVKQVTANFSWLTVQEFNIYIDYRTDADTARGFVCKMPGLAACTGTAICKDAKDIMSTLRPGNLIIFQAYRAVNRTGYVLKMSDLVLRIR